MILVPLGTNIVITNKFNRSGMYIYSASSATVLIVTLHESYTLIKQLKWRALGARHFSCLISVYRGDLRLQRSEYRSAARFCITSL